VPPLRAIATTPHRRDDHAHDLTSRAFGKTGSPATVALPRTGCAVVRDCESLDHLLKPIDLVTKHREATDGALVAGAHLQLTLQQLGEAFDHRHPIRQVVKVPPRDDVFIVGHTGGSLRATIFENARPSPATIPFLHAPSTHWTCHAEYLHSPACGLRFRCLDGAGRCHEYEW